MNKDKCGIEIVESAYLRDKYSYCRLFFFIIQRLTPFFGYVRVRILGWACRVG